MERLASSGRRSKQLPALVFPSALTLIDEGRCWYRGVEVGRAAADHRFEEVAEWLWRGRWPDEVRWPIDARTLDEVLAAQAALGPHLSARSVPGHRRGGGGARLPSPRHVA
ncbi:MAG: citrate/2-methylcitrate synthase [Acidimicrobiales bacterium]